MTKVGINASLLKVKGGNYAKGAQPVVPIHAKRARVET